MFTCAYSYEDLMVQPHAINLDHVQEAANCSHMIRLVVNEGDEGLEVLIDLMSQY